MVLQKENSLTTARPRPLTMNTLNRRCIETGNACIYSNRRPRASRVHASGPGSACLASDPSIHVSSTLRDSRCVSGGLQQHGRLSLKRFVNKHMIQNCVVICVCGQCTFVDFGVAHSSGRRLDFPTPLVAMCYSTRLSWHTVATWCFASSLPVQTFCTDAHRR